MNSKAKSIALLAVLSLAAVGCQKENIVEPELHTQQNVSVRNIVYSIDGVTFHRAIYGEQDWDTFLVWMTDMAKKGHSVSLKNENTSTNNELYAKDVETFVTNNENEAIEWCKKMTDLNYEVTMVYDERTGKFTCTAVK